MSDLRKAAQELLDSWDMPFNFHPAAHRFEKLRAALAQPESEPVAWLRQRDNVLALNDSGLFGSDWTPLYYAALAQPEQEQEPVAWMQETTGCIRSDWGFDKTGYVPLYTTPPQRKPLTDDQIAEILVNTFADTAMQPDDLVLIRAVEAAHGIGEKT